MQYIDQNGRQIVLGKCLGKGGEGAVYEFAGSPDLVAKIYHPSKLPLTPDKSEKLSVMLPRGTAEIMSFAAWPKATLHLNGKTVGLVLPRIRDSREIHELYSPAHRKIAFPRADWRFLVRVARNCAAAFATLHRHNIVIGDVNQGNLFVSRKAMINLIDCDSFQICTNGHIYRCPVGVAHFVPPELQHARLSEVMRTANHDNFGLAILIFHLLFMGRHPYSGRYSGAGDMPIEKAIREYRFPYSVNASRMQMGPPPNSLTLGALPQHLGVLFERAFSRGSELPNARPSATEWVHALEQLEGQLRQCMDDAGHSYFSQLSSCPWCMIWRAGGPNFFVAVTIQSAIARSAAFNLNAIWQQIQMVPRPDQAFKPVPRIATTQILPRPIPVAEDETRLVRLFAGSLAVLSIAVTPLAIFASTVAMFSLPIGLLSAMAFLVLTLNSPAVTTKRERKQVHVRKVAELHRAQAAQRELAHRYMQQFQAKAETLRQVRRDYEQISGQRDVEIQALRQHVQQRQLDDYLRQCFISDAHIPGIGPVKTAELESNSIETAFDVVREFVMCVPGFKEKTTEKLLAWRRQKEREFRFDPSKGVPQSDIQLVELKYANKRAQCERLLQAGPTELRNLSGRAQTEIQRLDEALARLEFEVAQSLADLRLAANIGWWK